MSTAVPGTCYLCHQTLSGSRIRRHLLQCIKSRTGIEPSPDPLKQDRRKIARKTAHLSVRARERPHWIEVGVRCDVPSMNWTGSCEASGWNAAAT